MKEKSGPLPRRVRLRLGSGADAERHYRDLSGHASREKRARRAILASMRGEADDGGDISMSAPLLGLDIGKDRDGPRPGAARPRKKHTWVYRLLSGRSHHTPFVAFNRFPFDLA